MDDGEDEIVFDNCSFQDCKISFNSDTDIIVKNSWVCGLGLDDNKHVTFENCYFSDNDSSNEGQVPILSTRRTSVFMNDCYVSCNYGGECLSFRESEEVRLVDTEAVGDDCGVFLGSSFDSFVEVEDCYMSNFSEGFILLDDSELSIVDSSGEAVDKWITMKHSSTTVSIEDSPKIAKESVADTI